MAAAFQNAATVISVTVQGTGGFYKSGKADVIGPFVDDRRVMGVAVADVHLAAAGKQHDIIAHLKQDKPEGWHETGWTDCAWTDGNALLPLEDHLIGHELAGIFRTPVIAWCCLYSYRKHRIYYEFQLLLNSISFNKLNL